MKRRESQRRERGEQQFARAALAELRTLWKDERPTKPKRTGGATRLMRLAAETREMLALWTYYRLACLDAMDTGPMGRA